MSRRLQRKLVYNVSTTSTDLSLCTVIALAAYFTQYNQRLSKSLQLPEVAYMKRVINTLLIQLQTLKSSFIIH